MVPDLSLTSDMSPNVSPKVKIKDNFERYRTLYPSAPIPESEPNHCLPSLGEQHILKPNHKYLANCLPSKVKLIDKQKERLFSSNETDCHLINNRIGFGLNQNQTNHRNDVKTNAKSDEKPVSCKSVKPKIVRHSSTSDPVLNANRVEKRCALKTNSCNTQNTVNSPINEEMYELIKQQDIQLQQISEQIQELIRIHKVKGNDNRTDTSSNKRSVMTMTSMVFDNNQSSPSAKPKKRVSKGVKNKWRTPSTTSKDLRGLHLQTISEHQTDPSDIDMNGLNLTQSPTRSPYLGQSSSIERIRANDNSSDCDDIFYDHMIDNINSMLNNPSSDETDESGHRSSCSPTPPQLKREPQHRKHQIQLQSEQTVYIKRLAAKYLVEEKSEHTKPKYKLKKSPQHYHQQQEHQVFAHNEKTDLKVYGLAKNASIATKNYLEKYGLTYSPPKVQKTPDFHENYNTNHNHNRHKTHKNRILDLEALKRQPKLT